MLLVGPIKPSLHHRVEHLDDVLVAHADAVVVDLVEGCSAGGHAKVLYLDDVGFGHAGNV